jgi:IS5 family transposase
MFVLVVPAIREANGPASIVVEIAGAVRIGFRDDPAFVPLVWPLKYFTGEEFFQHEFGVKASIATTNARAPGGKFVLARHNATRWASWSKTERFTGCEAQGLGSGGWQLLARSRFRSHANVDVNDLLNVDKGYRGHRAANPNRALSPAKSAASSASSTANCDAAAPSRTWSNAANVILTAVGHNLRLVLAWLRALCRLIA